MPFLRQPINRGFLAQSIAPTIADIEIVPLLPDAAELGAIHYWDFTDGRSVSGLADGDDITSVLDLVGGLDLVPVSAGKEPIWQPGMVGGKDAAYFDATAYLKGTGLTLTDFAVMLIGQMCPPQVNSIPYEFTTNASTGGMYLNANTSGMMVAVNSGGQSGYSTSTAWWGQTTPQMTIQRCDGTHAGHTFWVAGAERTLTPLGGYTTDPGVASRTDDLYVGGRAGSSLPIEGWIQQLALFDPIMVDDVRDQLEAYYKDNFDTGY